MGEKISSFFFMIIAAWLMEGQVKKLVLVITSTESKEVMERWCFDVETDQQVLATGESKEKDEKEIQKEIAAIIRQITSSVSFLPLLEEPCTFDMLVYTNLDTEHNAAKWEETDAKYIAKSNEVRLRSFTTKIHKVDTMVSYKVVDDE
jgi:mitotic spindle assembly checkpoint protein MAD2